MFAELTKSVCMDKFAEQAAAMESLSRLEENEKVRLVDRLKRTLCLKQTESSELIKNLHNNDQLESQVRLRILDTFTKVEERYTEILRCNLTFFKERVVLLRLEHELEIINQNRSYLKDQFDSVEEAIRTLQNKSNITPCMAKSTQSFLLNSPQT